MIDGDVSFLTVSFFFYSFTTRLMRDELWKIWHCNDECSFKKSRIPIEATSGS
jgi:hypothetical protein